MVDGAIDHDATVAPMAEPDLPARARRLLATLDSVDSVLSIRSRDSELSAFSSKSLLSAGSVGSILCVGSAGSILSFASAGSILSVGSAGSVLSVGSAGSLMSRWSFLAIGGRNEHFVRRHRNRALVGLATAAAVAAVLN